MRKKLQCIFHGEQFNPEEETGIAGSPMHICVEFSTEGQPFWKPSRRVAWKQTHAMV